MNVAHLELLRELAARGSLAAVAAATQRTPSALSQQLRTAERELGVALVEPVGRGLRLTAEGRLLADSADEVTAVIAQVQGRLDAAIGQPRGTVRIGTLPSAGTALLPPLLERLAGSEIEVDLDDFDLAEADYAARTLDVDIVIAHSLTGRFPPGTDHLTCRVLAHEPIDVAMPSDHPLAAHDRLRPEHLHGTTWIGVPVGYPFDTILQAVERANGERLERWVRLRDNRIIEALVRQGAGLALLPRFTTPLGDGLTTRPLLGVRAERTISALCRPDRHARLAVRHVVDELVAIGGGL
ncbi:LysR family transcriptional regulator [Nocardioides seonyuensis]|uniref:LysR family transcriptional regulator n=1 Tax=Nocardioides seonyuensis TaxID=2518371 RepID=A0A4P7IDL0_9ACTN|nr:LysR family transcriptional regulator [Nocardioides seonyuensis]QBX55259.1 LysR family transcriptional regulator [Nocardioides seonyuensis]